MFPWHGEGKSSSFLLATSQRQQQQQQQQQPQAQAQAQAQRQSSPQQSSSRQDGGTGYGRWRLSSVLQQGQGQDVNEKTSSNSQTNDRVTESSPREEPVPSSGDDDEEEEEEDGEAEEQGESEGGDIDFRASRNEANPAASVSNNSTNGTEQQGQRQGQRLGERVPPLGYPPQPSFRNNHARRLNTEEEIKLFELCIKNSATFGERSKLCEWWKNIANEFIENYGGPYSWHSVRRKVDLVTRQRIKYLADLKEGKIEADQATEPWKKVLDEWIPTWEKFEIAEKRRIEVRDARAASRKRKEPSGAASGSSPSSPAPSSATKRTSTTAAAPPPGSWQATPQRWIPAPYGPGPYPPPPGPGYMGPPPPSTPGMKLPDGYDTMFRTPAPHPSTHPLYSHPPPQPYYPPPNAIPQGPATAVDSNLTSAVLETLAKLNKHLEKADSTSSPIVTALTGSNDKNNKDTNNNSNTTAQDGTTSPPSSSSEGAEAEAAESTEQTTTISSLTWKKFHAELRTEFETELAKMREAFTAKLDALEQTQEMIMEMLRQEPGREGST